MTIEDATLNLKQVLKNFQPEQFLELEPEARAQTIAEAERLIVLIRDKQHIAMKALKDVYGPTETQSVQRAVIAFSKRQAG